MSRFCGRIASARVPVFIGASLGPVIQQPQITGHENSAGGAARASPPSNCSRVWRTTLCDGLRMGTPDAPDAAITRS